MTFSQLSLGQDLSHSVICSILLLFASRSFYSLRSSAYKEKGCFNLGGSWIWPSFFSPTQCETPWGLTGKWGREAGKGSREGCPLDEGIKGEFWGHRHLGAFVCSLGLPNEDRAAAGHWHCLHSCLGHSALNQEAGCIHEEKAQPGFPEGSGL